ENSSLIAHQACEPPEIAWTKNGLVLIERQRQENLERLDADLSHIRWTPTNKKPHKARIAIENIREIRIGKNTEQLRHSEANLGELQEECLILRDLRRRL
ncbi:hypothetical protein COOONC_18936, partial [Cooperia oncophora]